MLDNQFPEQDLKQGLPPRDHHADVPEHANSSTVWMGGIIAVCGPRHVR